VTRAHRRAGVLGRVGIDELDLDRRVGPRAEEQELIARRDRGSTIERASGAST